jgi:sporulation protein YlmC with PRC-barrel domain
MSPFLAEPLLVLASVPGALGGSRRDTRMDPRPEQGPAAGPGARLVNASRLYGDRVVNRRGELLGTVNELLLDVERGAIAYAVMAYGGFMGVGERLFALPWSALKLNPEAGCLVIDAERSTFDSAPAFDRDHWPSEPDAKWHRGIHRHFRSKPYWD